MATDTRSPAGSDPAAPLLPWMHAAAKDIAARWLITGGDPVDWLVLYESMATVIAKHAPAPAAEGCELANLRILAESILDPLYPDDPAQQMAVLRKLASDAAVLAATAGRAGGGAAAPGWVTVTDDPATWPERDLQGPVLVYMRSIVFEGEEVRDTFDEAGDARNYCSRGHVIRWMPWPAAVLAATAGRAGGG